MRFRGHHAAEGPPPKRSANAIAVVALAVSMFAVGTTEFVIVGLLPTIAEHLDVSISTIGLVVTAYALGIAVGGSLITAWPARVPRKRLLLALMTLFVAGNLACGLAPSFAALLVARVATSFSHAAFAGAGIALAISLVEERRQGSATAVMFGGATLALAIGVRLGTFVGEHFGWRTAFYAVALIGTIALAADAILLPEAVAPPTVRLRRQLSELANRRVVPRAADDDDRLCRSDRRLHLFDAVPRARQRLPSGQHQRSARGFRSRGRRRDVHRRASHGQISPDPARARACCAGRRAGAHDAHRRNPPRSDAHADRMGRDQLRNRADPPAARGTGGPHSADIVGSLNISAFNLRIAIGAVLGGRVVASSGVHAVTWVGTIVVSISVGLASINALGTRRARLAGT